MRKMMSLLSRMRHEEEGQSLVEYGLIIALIALVVIAAFTLLSGNLTNMFDSISAKL